MLLALRLIGRCKYNDLHFHVTSGGTRDEDGYATVSMDDVPVEEFGTEADSKMISMEMQVEEDQERDRIEKSRAGYMADLIASSNTVDIDNVL